MTTEPLRPPVSRGAVLVEFGGRDGADVTRLLELASRQCRGIRLIGISEQMHPVGACAPLAGLDVLAVRDEAYRQAASATCAALEAVAGDVWADHCAVRSWRHALAVARDDTFDRVLLLEPRRLSDRVQLRWFAKSPRQEMVVLRPTRRAHWKIRLRAILYKITDLLGERSPAARGA